MLYEHDVSGCFSDRVGAGGLTQEALGGRLAAAAEALEKLRAAARRKSMALLGVPASRDDIPAMRAAAQRLTEGARDILIFGMGGSCLGGQVLAQLIGWNTPAFEWPAGRPRVHFVDNLDAQSLSEAFLRLSPATTRFVVISKSGGTPETLSQMLASLAFAGKDAGRKFAVICEPKSSPARRLAERHGMAMVDHPPDVGGRFSILTAVGLLPALLMGLDVVKLREGAQSVLSQALDAIGPEDVPPAMGAAIAVALAEDAHVAMNVYMPYLDRLERFAMWTRQIWAESLGKNGKGTTPIRALGPVDQHSQVQLYLDGPRNKYFTIMMGPVAGTGPLIGASETGGDPELSYLEHRTVGDLVEAEQRATAESLMQNGRPTRLISLPRLDESVLGALLMHFMLETIIAAELMDVNAFDQPAVEQGKILARQFLKDGLS